MFKKFSILFVLVLVFSLLLTACGTPATPAPVVEPAAGEPTVAPVVPTDVPAVVEPAATEKTKVRWFVGLGAGSDEPTFAPQQAFVDEFNASQDKIELVLEIVDNDVAYDTLATQIAAGNAPDIVGPTGIRGRDSFKGAWLDLAPMIEKYSYDLSDFDPALVKFNEVKEEGQLGIPFAIYPSFVIYNQDLFDEAGLPYPPAEYGMPYVDENGVEKEWNVDTVKELAMKLTVDANGQDATSATFDSEQIVQFGWMNQFTDPRGIGTMFGAGSLVADDGVTAQVPENWKAAWKWSYDGYWNSWFIPNGPYGGADFLQGGGGPFSSGNLAMVQLHMWYVAPWALGGVPFGWDLAASPSYNGVTTAKLHADTFGILKGSKNQDAAFEVLSYMLSEEHATDLLNVYGGMPARYSLQGDYFATYSEANFPGLEINWDIVPASMAYNDNPNHESWMPSFQETTDRYNEFWNYIANTPDLDLDAEIELLVVDLQKIFDAAK
jgi:multiple sugar transport system substrate-binding protein